jgi:hypothetical protein
MTNRQYQLRFWTLIAVYVLLVAATSAAFRNSAVPRFLDIPVSLLPMLPAFGILLIAMARHRSMDELAQRMQAEAIMFAFGATGIVTFSYGFLESTAGAPMLSYFWVWGIMSFGWVIGAGLAYLRYR